MFIVCFPPQCRLCESRLLSALFWFHILNIENSTRHIVVVHWRFTDWIKITVESRACLNENVGQWRRGESSICVVCNNVFGALKGNRLSLATKLDFEETFIKKVWRLDSVREGLVAYVSSQVLIRKIRGRFDGELPGLGLCWGHENNNKWHLLWAYMVVPSLLHVWCLLCQLLLTVTLQGRHCHELHCTEKEPRWEFSWETIASNDWRCGFRPIVSDVKAQNLHSYC